MLAILTTATLTAIIQGPTILPDHCRALVALPYVDYWQDPHGAIDPTGFVAWKNVNVYFSYPEKSCTHGKMIVGTLAPSDGIGHGVWQPLGEVVPL